MKGSPHPQLTQNPAFCAVSVESWHFGLIIGSVILVSSCRLLLLKIWPDFAESSKAANQQVYSLVHCFVSRTSHIRKLVLIAYKFVINSLKGALIGTADAFLLELQVLTSLEPLDYLVVSFLPGISEVESRRLFT